MPVRRRWRRGQKIDGYTRFLGKMAGYIGATTLTTETNGNNKQR
jgi:hypothetical protein